MPDLHAAKEWAKYLQDPAIVHTLEVMCEHGISHDMALLLLEITGLRNEVGGLLERLEQVSETVDHVLRTMGEPPPGFLSDEDDEDTKPDWLAEHRKRYPGKD